MLMSRGFCWNSLWNALGLNGLFLFWRSCEDVENVATCKETFNLYYYETDRDEATTTFPPWREDAYIKVSEAIQNTWLLVRYCCDDCLIIVCRGRADCSSRNPTLACLACGAVHLALSCTTLCTGLIAAGVRGSAVAHLKIWISWEDDVANKSITLCRL